MHPATTTTATTTITITSTASAISNSNGIGDGHSNNGCVGFARPAGSFGVFLVGVSHAAAPQAPLLFAASAPAAAAAAPTPSNAPALFPAALGKQIYAAAILSLPAALAAAAQM